MKLRARLGTRKDVRHESADNRTDDPEPDRPHDRHVHVHERFRSPPGDQTNNDVPNQMKHNVSSFEFRIGGYQPTKPETMRIMRPTSLRQGYDLACTAASPAIISLDFSQAA